MEFRISICTYAPYVSSLFGFIRCSLPRDKDIFLPFDKYFIYKIKNILFIKIKIRKVIHTFPKTYIFIISFVTFVSRSIIYSITFQSFHQSQSTVTLNLLLWNDVPRTSRIFCPKIAIFSQF